jgi:hypothetical protein
MQNFACFFKYLNLVVNLPLLPKRASILFIFEMVKYEMMQPKTMQLTTNKLLRVETSVGRFFQFFKNLESLFFEYFSESKNCQFRFFEEKTIQKFKNPSKTLKEPQFS